MGMESKEIDRFMNLIDLMRRNTKISLQQKHDAKKVLVMRFIQGPLANKEIILDP